MVGYTVKASGILFFLLCSKHKLKTSIDILGSYPNGSVFIVRVPVFTLMTRGVVRSVYSTYSHDLLEFVQYLSIYLPDAQPYLKSIFPRSRFEPVFLGEKTPFSVNKPSTPCKVNS